jgi:hypothetical protein
VVAAHHVADGVDREPRQSRIAHVAADALGAGAVRVGQVGDGELAFLGKAGVAVLGQGFLPVPHQVAQHRLGHAELVVQADFGNAVDVAQALGHLEVGVVVQPPRKGVDDLALGQPRAARAAHGQDEREAELARCSRR